MRGAHKKGFNVFVCQRAQKSRDTRESFYGSVYMYKQKTKIIKGRRGSAATELVANTKKFGIFCNIAVIIELP